MTIHQADLDSLGLRLGDARQLSGQIEPEQVELGGQTYGAKPPETEFRLDVSRTTTGFAMRLRFEVGLAGPCFRCLEPALTLINVDVREVDQPAAAIPTRGPLAEEEEEELASAAELESPYVDDGVLDVAAWIRDALILALPNQIVCREDCAGLCQYCGETLNGAEPGAHDHGENLDPRWAKLRDIS